MTMLVRLLGQPTPLRPSDLLPPDQPFKPHPPVRRWRRNAGIRGLVFFGLFVAIQLATMVVTGAVLVLIGRDASTVLATMAAWANVVAIVPALLAYWLLVRWWEERKAHELSGRRLVRETALGLALGAVFMLACVGVLALFGAYRVHGLDVAYNPWPAILTVGFGAGIVEEVLFRGILYRLLEDTFGTWTACALSALVFGLAHLMNPHASWQGAIGIALEAGLLFAALYAFTRSLWVVMGVHFAWNVVQGPILGIVVSGSSAQGHGLVRSTLTGPEWLSGGAFGAEASLVTIVLLTSVAVWILSELNRRGLVVAPSWVRRRTLLAAPAPAPEPETGSGAQEISQGG